MNLNIYPLSVTCKDPPSQKSFCTSTIIRTLDIQISQFLDLLLKAYLSIQAKNTQAQKEIIKNQVNFNVVSVQEFDCYVTVHNKINIRTGRMSEIAEMNNKFDLQDTQIDGGSCCYSVVRSRSASSTVQFFRNSLRGQQQRTKDKGIKRVVQNNVKRQQKREKLNKRGIQSAKGMKEGELQMVSKGSYEDVQAVEEVPLKKILATKKCLDYKNKKIQEHHLNSEHIPVITINVRSECNLKPQLTLPQHKQNPTLSLSYDLPFLTPKKTETSASTQKNTPRCLNESGDISIPSHFLSTLLQQAGETYKERLSGSLLKLNKSQKTLERLYERQLGRTMEVFQSQMSEADDLYSVAESFEWRQQ